MPITDLLLQSVTKAYSGIIYHTTIYGGEKLKITHIRSQTCMSETPQSSSSFLTIILSILMQMWLIKLSYELLVFTSISTFKTGLQPGSF